MATPPSSVKYVKAVWFKNSEHKAVEIQVIPRAWVFKGVDKVYWPSHNIKKHRLEGSKPDSDWSHYDLVICSQTMDSIQDAYAIATDTLIMVHDDGITGDELFESEVDSNVEGTQTTRSGRRIKSEYLETGETVDHQLNSMPVASTSGHRHPGQSRRSLSLSPSLSLEFQFPKPDDSGLDLTRVIKRVYSMLTIVTKGQDVILRTLGTSSDHVDERVVELEASLPLGTSSDHVDERVVELEASLPLGTSSDHVLERVVELEASLPCTTHEEWDTLEEKLGIDRLSLVGIEILYN